MIIRRIGKDNVIRSVATIQVAEHVTTEYRERIVTQLLFYGADKSGLHCGLLYGHHLSATPRHELPANGTGAGKEIERTLIFQVLEILDNVKYVFAGEIGRGACCDVFRHIKASTSVFPSDYSHSYITNYGINLRN
jgi:hypothetical protein